ncbi:Uncharacterised protein [Serratia quinivorans]|uniref:hypothetical protein n=1 Tax=Serratia quinivorans TaxID=137545 RepID=UPI00217BB1F8|nr:hypothetical protein [Serratia quinivorans]CAI1124448.1 Uncharacterised protein [Serratia quinivorans]
MTLWKTAVYVVVVGLFGEVGVVRGFSYTQEFDGTGFLRAVVLSGGVTVDACRLTGYEYPGFLIVGASSKKSPTNGLYYSTPMYSASPKDCAAAAEIANKAAIWDVRLPWYASPNGGGHAYDKIDVVVPYGGGKMGYWFEYRQPPGPSVPTPATCNAAQPAPIDFKTMSANDIPTAPVGTTVTVTCTRDTKVKATFTFSDGTDDNLQNNGLAIKLKVDGWPGGGTGFTYNAIKDVPLLINANATLSAPGKVTEGIFRTIGVVKLSYD